MTALCEWPLSNSHTKEPPTSILTFTFSVTCPPAVKFTFDSKIDAWNSQPLKRRRPLWDVDGTSSTEKKKRRLRLNLITSRLSRPFSYPATNIADRGPSAIRLWARKRAREKNELRKAAIMNSVRKGLQDLKARNNSALPLKPLFVPPRPTHSQLVSQLALRDILAAKLNAENEPLPPSPLGVSNYDALDMDLDDSFIGRGYDGYEDDEGDGEGDCDMSGERLSRFCDFDLVGYDSACASLGDNYDYLDEMDGIPVEVLEEEEMPPVVAMDVDKIIMGVMEREVQHEVCLRA